MTSRQRKQSSNGASSLSTDSSESSDLVADVRKLSHLLRQIRESIKILAEWTDGMVEEFYDVLHVRMNMVAWSVEPIEIDFRDQLTKALKSLPGGDPTVPFPTP